MIKTFLQNNEIKTDELGRMIIEDLNILEKLNGAIIGVPEFVLDDGACGNANCVC